MADKAGSKSAGSSPAGGKPAMSSKLSGLKFMQRAKERQELAAALEKSKEMQEDDRGGAASEHAAGVAGTSGVQQLTRGSTGAGGGCTIIYQSDPRPGSAVGRFSFGAGRSGPSAEDDGGKVKKEEPETGPAVTDEDMAKTIGRKGAGAGGKGRGSGAAAASPAGADAKRKKARTK